MKRLSVTFPRRKSVITLGVLVSTIICLAVITVVSCSNSINPSGIVIHHSAVPFNIEKPEDVNIISKIHAERGFSIFYWGRFYNIGYHYLILPDGQIIQGRPDKCRGAHAKGHNDSIGICLIGNFNNDNPTQVQVESLNILIRNLRKRYLIEKENISPHYDLDNKTECPGYKFPIEEILNGLK